MKWNMKNNDVRLFLSIYFRMFKTQKHHRQRTFICVYGHKQFNGLGTGNELNIVFIVQLNKKKGWFSYGVTWFCSISSRWRGSWQSKSMKNICNFVLFIASIEISRLWIECVIVYFLFSCTIYSFSCRENVRWMTHCGEWEIKKKTTEKRLLYVSVSRCGWMCECCE